MPEALGAMFSKVAASLSNATAAVDLRDMSMIDRSHRDWWSYIFSAFSTTNSIPTSQFPSDEWTNFLFKQSIPGVVICCISGAICLYLLFQLCCTHVKPDGKLPVNHKRYIENFACQGLLVVWIFAGMAIGRGMYSFEIISNSVIDLQPDIYMVVGEIVTLQPQLSNSVMWMNGWEESCSVGWDAIEPSAKEQIVEVNANLTDNLNTASSLMNNLTTDLRDAPQMFEEIKVRLEEFIENHKILIGCSIFVPTIIVTLVILVITYAVRNENGNESVLWAANFFMLELGAVPMVVLIMLITGLLAVLMFVGVTTGSFCKNPESNTVNLVEALQGANSTNRMVTLTSFYLTGVPAQNFLVEDLRSVQNEMRPISQSMVILGPALDLLGMMCNRLSHLDLITLIPEVNRAITSILPLAMRDNVFDRYDNIVIRGVCGQFVSSLGWYMLCQMYAAFVVLPAIAMLSSRYLCERAAEKKHQDKQAKDEHENLLMSTKREKAKDEHENLLKKQQKCCSVQ